jgi:hypothetical protein
MRNQINKTINKILNKRSTSITLSKYKDIYRILLSKGFPYNCWQKCLEKWLKLHPCCSTRNKVFFCFLFKRGATRESNKVFLLFVFFILFPFINIINRTHKDTLQYILMHTIVNYYNSLAIHSNTILVPNFQILT